MASRDRQRGVALLAALILMLALVLTLGNIFFRHQLEVSRLSSSLHQDQAFLLGLSAENWARQLLSSDRDDREIDSLDENWALAVPVLPIEDGFVRGCLQDLQGRLNLNDFGAFDEESWKQQLDSNGNGIATTWLNLLRNRDFSANEAMVAELVDWIDADSNPINQWGAEQSAYDFDRSLVMVANSPFTDVEELAVLRSYNTDIVRQLKDSLSALPESTPVNINTASREVLLAMGADYPEQFADFVIRQRPFYRLDTFRGGLASALSIEEDEAKALWPDSLISVNSDYFLLQLEVSLGEMQIRLSSVLDRHNREAPVVLARNIAVIPAMLESSGDNKDEKPSFCSLGDQS